MTYSKYRARKTVVGGITFASKKEAKRYEELFKLEKLGIVSQLELQPVFIVSDKFSLSSTAKTYREVKYIADFKYVDNTTGRTVVEDVKGVKTESYKIKKKLFLKLFGETLDFKEL